MQNWSLQMIYFDRYNNCYYGLFKIDNVIDKSTDS